MKQFILLILFSFIALFATAQQSLSDRLALNEPQPEDRTNINVYPNPATSFIGLSNHKGVERILIFNMVGRQMKSFEAGKGDNRYFIGDLNRGMYLVQILGENNKVITTKRVSKR
jgi:hypothetical protein